MSNKIETIRLGILGEEPLYSKQALMKARSEFIKVYGYEPDQLRVSPKAFNDLRSFAERYEYPYGFDVKVENDFDDEQWIVCKENTKVFAV